MSEDRLTTVLGAVTRLAGLVENRADLADDLQKVLAGYECTYCGELARDTVSLCAECEAAVKCDQCGDPCVEGYYDRENSTCERCYESAVSDERAAARREFDRREAAMDDEYSRRKDERSLEALREVRR